MESGPEPLSEIISRLFIARGWGRRQDRLRLERAWADVAGASINRQTRVGALKRGVLEIEVGNGALLQELVSFHKRGLLAKMKEKLPGVPLKDLKFRAGVVEQNR